MVSDRYKSGTKSLFNVCHCQVFVIKKWSLILNWKFKLQMQLRCMHKASLKITGAEKYTQLLVSRTHGLARHLSSSNGRCRAVGAGPAWEPRAPLCLCRAVPAEGRD